MARPWNTSEFAGTHKNPLAVTISGHEQSQFGEIMTVSRTPIIELNSAYGTSALRDIETTANGGTIAAAATGEIQLNTGTTANGSAILKSASRIRYIPGYGAEVGIGIRLPAAPTGNEYANWGIREDGANEGIYFGQDATGLYVARLRGGTETKVRQSAWNIDKLDGSGPSDFTVDTANGNVWQIRFTWYGYGQIEWGLLAVDDGEQQFHVIHQEKVDGTTSIQSPNLPIIAEVNNGGDTTDLEMEVGGRQASIIGQYVPKFRFIGQERTGVSTSTTTKPIVSFRAKSAFKDIGLKIAGFSAVPTTEDVIMEIYLNPTSITNASWTTPTNATAAETAVETDVSGTAISGGTLIYSAYLLAGVNANRGNISSRLLDLDIPEDQVVSLCARTTANTGSIAAHFELTEEW